MVQDVPNLQLSHASTFLGDQAAIDDDDLSSLSDRSDITPGEFERLKAMQKQKFVTWDSLPFAEKAKLFNKWSLM